MAKLLSCILFVAFFLNVKYFLGWVLCLCVSHFLFCTRAEHTYLMENTGAPTAGMASSSGQDIPKVIS
jgi:hypothetical protein